MACCVMMAAIFGLVMGVKGALFGASRNQCAQAWRLDDKEVR